MTQEQIAELLVARRWAERKPLRQHRCWKTIELRSLCQCTCYACTLPGRKPHGTGNLYVTEAGEILTGHTRREARPVGPQTRRRMLGGNE